MKKAVMDLYFDDVSPVEAAAVACAVSSVTIQKLGETGTATIGQVKERAAAVIRLAEEEKEWPVRL